MLNKLQQNLVHVSDLVRLSQVRITDPNLSSIEQVREQDVRHGMTHARFDLVAPGDGTRFQHGSTVKDRRGRLTVSACIDNNSRLRKTVGNLSNTPLTAPPLITIAARREVLRIVQLLLGGDGPGARGVVAVLVYASQHVREVGPGRGHRVVESDDLILDALAPLDRESEQLLKLLRITIACREDEFRQSREGLAHRVLITLRHSRIERREGIQITGVIQGTQVPQRLRQVVDDEPVPAREELGPHDVDLPSGQVVMDAVHVRGVVVGLGQGLKKVGGSQHGGHGPRRVADEDHRGLGRNRAVATRERLVREVVLERVDQAALHALVPGEFIEGDDIPVAHQADAPGRVVNEELRQRHLTARHEDAVG